MTYEELNRLFIPACRVLELPTRDYVSVDDALELDKLLGITEYNDFHYSPATALLKPMPDELRNLFEALNGPHAKTMLKVYRIRKGLE